jgi:hypothetical protein
VATPGEVDVGSLIAPLREEDRLDLLRVDRRLRIWLVKRHPGFDAK